MNNGILRKGLSIALAAIFIFSTCLQAAPVSMDTLRTTSLANAPEGVQGPLVETIKSESAGKSTLSAALATLYFQHKNESVTAKQFAQERGLSEATVREEMIGLNQMGLVSIDTSSRPYAYRLTERARGLQDPEVRRLCALDGLNHPRLWFDTIIVDSPELQRALIFLRSINEETSAHRLEEIAKQGLIRVGPTEGLLEGIFTDYKGLERILVSTGYGRVYGNVVDRCAALIRFIAGKKAAGRFIKDSRMRPDNPMILTANLGDWDRDRGTDGGLLLASSLGFQSACDEALLKYGKDMDHILSKGKARVGSFSDAGSATRAGQISLAQGGSRGDVSIAGDVLAPDGTVYPLTLLLGTVLQASIYAGTNNGSEVDVWYVSQMAVDPDRIQEYLDILRPDRPYRGYDVIMLTFTDEIQRRKQEAIFEKIFGGRSIPKKVPSTPQTKHRLFSKFVTKANKEDITPEALRDLGMYVLDGKGDVRENYPKGKFANYEEVDEAILSQGREVAYSFGSHRISYEFLVALERYYGDKVVQRSPKSPIDIIEPPIIVEPILHYLAGKSVTEIAKIVGRSREEVENILEFAKFAGITTRSDEDEWWMGAVNIGSNVYWWRFRRPGDIYQIKMLMLADLTGESIQVDADGFISRITEETDRPGFEKDTAHAKAMRAFQGINHPITNCVLGDVEIDSNGVRSDNGHTVTFEDIVTGVEIGGVRVKGSILRNSKIPKGNAVVGSVVNNSRGNISCRSSYLDGAAPRIDIKLTANEAFLYHVFNELTSPGKSVVAIDIDRTSVSDVFGSGIEDSRYPNGWTRMWSGYGIDGRAASKLRLVGLEDLFADPEQFKAAAFEFRGVLVSADGQEILPGAAQILRDLKVRGKKIAVILTDADEERMLGAVVEKNQVKFGTADYHDLFDVVIIEKGASAFNSAAVAMSVNAQECAALETVKGAKLAASATGMKSIGVDTVKTTTKPAVDGVTIESMQQLQFRGTNSYSFIEARSLQALKANSAGELKGIIFDLDGVLTSTTAIHFAEWKKMFERAFQHFLGEKREFTIEDYDQHVDGIPGPDGCLSMFLAVGVPQVECIRDIGHFINKDKPDQQNEYGALTLPQQQAMEIVWDWSEYKNTKYKAHIKAHPGEIEILPGALKLLNALRVANLKIGVASSSRSTPDILGYTKLDQYVDAVVSGVDIGTHSEPLDRVVQGKPMGDIFVLAAHRLGLEADQCIGFEDAEKGVQAIRAAGIRCVGVDPRKSGKLEPYLGPDDKVIESLKHVDIPWLQELHAAKANSAGAIEGVIFDSDGVISSTEIFHFNAWKRMFEEEYGRHTETLGKEFNYADHRLHVLGRSRGDGALSMLAASGIEAFKCLQNFDHFIDPEEEPMFFKGLLQNQRDAMEEVRKLADLKNTYFQRMLIAKPEDVKILPGAVAILKALKSRGIKVALISSSKNTPAVLQIIFSRLAGEFGTADFREFFDAVITGDDIGQKSRNLGRRIQGKPKPDAFLEAAFRMGVDPKKCVGVEDAESGIQAIKAAGMFAVGIDFGKERMRPGLADKTYSTLARIDLDKLALAAARVAKSHSAGSLKNEIHEIQNILLDAATEELNAGHIRQINKALNAIAGEIRKTDSEELPASDRQMLLAMVQATELIISYAELQTAAARTFSDGQIVYDPRIIPDAVQRQAVIKQFREVQEAIENGMTARDAKGITTASTQVVLFEDVLSGGVELAKNAVIISNDETALPQIRKRVVPSGINNDNGLFVTQYLIAWARGCLSIDTNNYSRLIGNLERLYTRMTGMVMPAQLKSSLRDGSWDVMSLIITLLPDVEALGQEEAERLHRISWQALIAA